MAIEKQNFEIVQFLLSKYEININERIIFTYFFKYYFILVLFDYIPNNEFYEILILLMLMIFIFKFNDIL